MTAETAASVETSAAGPTDASVGTVAFEIDRAIEAILMVADEPQSLVALATALSRPIAVVRQSIERLAADFDGEGGGVRRGFELREVGGGWRVYVRREYDSVVSDFVLTQNPTKLSQAALETLAVIAYKQPISRGQVAQIRAVNVDSVARTLLGRGLIAEVGNDPETGAILYGTTEQLLVHLGLTSLDELPKISPLLSDGRDGFDGQHA
ncbi:SMC-Scp complex subunit ScpB [Rathayibacter sp. VKM Ac-2803]|uniref:SMC-Scp complex subunit ScpB n=1 Tax=unclassified Rathayibacter TaxID=2609250 RepID=UPI0013575C49|nr:MULTISPECIES: SMC-Scp complex subunit ScpB [unclassified Rathayibacter]MWV49569.1 SMC-Scp complex subunit ScpB [Rathayibacter sp. VKM Ac-2803]MWV59703.1 SMC-Scp complex subunit ScpB [Rathayibacter sp. VKM Ac-2754]